jgi:hypothetical protein
MINDYVESSTKNEISRCELLHTRFVNGLKEDYGMSDEEIINVEQNWFYCGYRHNESEWDDGAKQFRFYFTPDIEIPDFSNSCVCRQKLLVRNDWITDGNEVLIIGQCCKDMFIVHRLKTCQICKEPHKNRSDNYCNKCRDRIKRDKIMCDCGNKKKEMETECGECYVLSDKCHCGKNKKEGYKQCYNCFRGSKSNTLDSRIASYLMNSFLKQRGL